MNIAVYKSGLLLGTGSINAAATSVTGFTASATVGQGRNVQALVTGGTSSGVFNTRVTADGGTSLTLRDACPFA